jgi:hypothetical protein
MLGPLLSISLSQMAEFPPIDPHMNGEPCSSADARALEHASAASCARLQPRQLGNLLRPLARPEPIKDWSQPVPGTAQLSTKNAGYIP